MNKKYKRIVNLLEEAMKSEESHGVKHGKHNLVCIVTL